MDSAFKSLQSQPYHNDHTLYGPYYPGNEATPPQKYMNPVGAAPVHECLPWGGSYSAPPAACHGYCNHSYWAPHCALGSPHSYVPPIPPYHFTGSYHPYPIQYMTPPGYSVDHRYEYEKNVSGAHHCCGCPNHALHQKDQRRTRIEEEETDRERRRIKSDDSVFPFQLSNQPYPVVWLPPDYGISSNNFRNKESLHAEKPDQNRKSVNAEPPDFLNGWYPLDLSKWLSSKKGRDGERIDHQLDDDVKGRFPFPVVWMPFKPDRKEKEDHKVNGAIAQPKLGLEGLNDERFTVNEENNSGQTTAQARGIPALKAVQHVDLENLKAMDKRLNASGGGHASQVKDIPVKEMRQHEDIGNPIKKSTDDGERKKLDNGVKKSAKDGTARESPSPPRSSKLPPVCLRVDPVPKRKSAKGSLRSPSSSGKKQQLDNMSNEASGVFSSSVNKKLDDINQKEAKQGKFIAKNVEVIDGKTQNGERVNITKGSPISISVNSQEVPKDQIEMNPVKDNGASCKAAKPDDAVVSDSSGNDGFVKVEDSGLVGAEEMRTGESKRKLSDDEAAVIIQSMFRGFDVRRQELIKKLNQIANVREHTAEVKHLIQSLESSSSDSNSKSKQRTVIGETIMSLLLKLDTIQGLHPSVKEIRKSVVKELVNLQEKLDLMKDEKSETTPLRDSVEGQEGDASLNHLDGESKPESLGVIQLNINEAEANAVGENCMNKEQGSALPVTEGDKHDAQNDTLMSKESLVLESSCATSEANPVEHKANKEIPDEASDGKESSSKAPTENDNEGSEVAVDHKSSNDGNQKNVAGQSSEFPLLQVNSREVAPEEGTALAESAQDVYYDNFDGNLSKETSLPIPMGEDGGKIGAESFMTKESAAELCEDMNNKVHVGDDISILKKHDREDLVLQTSPEVPCLKIDSSLVTELAPTEADADAGKGCGIYKVTQSDPSDLCAQESPSYMEFESSGLFVDTVDRETEACMENSKALDLYVDGVDAGSEIKGCSSLNICKLECTMEDELKATGVVAGDCAAHQPENTIACTFDHSGSSEAERSCSGKYLSGNTLLEKLGEVDVNNSILEESPNSYTGRRVDTKAIEPVKKVNEEGPGVDQIEPVNCTISEKGIEVTKEAENQESQKIHACEENATTKGVVEEDLTEKNRKLMDENERLRAVVEELMKSEKEQVCAIRTLLRRVKDLEKRLPRKKPVKVKQHPKSKTGSVKPYKGF